MLTNSPARPARPAFLTFPTSSEENLLSIQIALPFLLSYAALFPGGQLKSFGVAVNIGETQPPAPAPAPAPTPAEDAYSPSISLQILGQLDSWKGDGSRTLLDPFWLPGRRFLLNGAVMAALSAEYLEPDATHISENISLFSGLQMPLLAELLYVPNPPPLWIRGSYRLRVRNLLAPDPAAEQESRYFSWELEAMAGYLTESYMRSSAEKSTVLAAGHFLKLGGRATIPGFGALYSSLSSRRENDTSIVIGLEYTSDWMDARLEVDYRSRDQVFYSRLFSVLRGFFRPEFGLNVFWHESGPRFQRGELGIALELENVLLKAELWLENEPGFNAAAESMLDFLPPVFDTLVGLKIDSHFIIPLPEYQLKIDFTINSPSDLFLDSIIYGGQESAEFLAGWELRLGLTLKPPAGSGPRAADRGS